MKSRRRWLYRLELCICSSLFAIAFFGCAGPRICMEPEDARGFIDDARDSVALAREAGAYQSAPEQIARAESLLARAEEAAKEEKRGAESIRFASEAKAKAEVAYAVSRQMKAHEQEMQRVSSDRSREIAALETAQKEARTEKAREIQVYAKKVEQIEREKNRELAAAKTALKAAEDKADRKERELAVAASESEASKEKLREVSRKTQGYSERIERIEKERAKELAAAKADLKAAENDTRKAEAKVREYSEKTAAMEREQEKEIAVHVVRKDTAQKRDVEAEIEKRLFRGKPSLETLEEVRKATEGWRIAWQRKDLDRYMSYYADNAEIAKVVVTQGKEKAPQKLTKSEMRDEIEKIFAEETQFSAQPEPSLRAGSYVVRATFELFKQVPAQARKHEKWIKELWFSEVEDEWKIVEEDWKLYQDIPEFAERP